MPTNNSLPQKLVYALRLAHLYAFHRTQYQIIQRVRQEKLSYLGLIPLTDLLSAAREVEQKRLPGIWVEAGAGMAGSSMVIASTKVRNRPFFVYDTFEMIPPPSHQDGQDAQDRYQEIVSGKAQGIRGEAYYGYQQNLYARVQQSFDRYGLPIGENSIHLVKGLFQDTMAIEQPVSFAHIDCDWYDSVITCLNQIEPNLVHGGTLVIDDYYDWSGCRKAVDEYFSGKRGNFEFQEKSRLHIHKK